MYQLTKQQENCIEIALQGAMNRQEFQEMMEELSSLCTKRSHVNVIFDTNELLDHYSFKVFLDEYKFCRNFRAAFEHVVFVSEDESEVFLLDQFNERRKYRTVSRNRIRDTKTWFKQSESGSLVTQ